MAKSKKIAVLPGDGIGPEVMSVAIEIIDKAAKKHGLGLEYIFKDVGGIAIDRHQTPLPEDTLRTCEQSEAILFGSVGGPKWEDLPPEQQPERGALLPLRKHFGLFANLRPAIVFPQLKNSSPIKDHIIGQGVDIMIVRELTGGIYFGQPKSKNENSALDTLVYHRNEIERIARVGFEMARKRKKHLTSIDKANVLTSMVFWRETVTEIGKEYPDVTLEHMYVDNAAMQLILRPNRFDVILACNMFGDILSDEASVLSGSLGMLPSASLSEGTFGLYEPAGGSAPDIAGKGIANPIAQIMSGALMLKYSFDLDQAYEDISLAIARTLDEGMRTGDIAEQGQKISNTQEIAQAILAKI